MKTILAILSFSALLVAGFAFAGVEMNKTAAAQNADLLAQLPASEAVAVVDMKRMFNETLPQMFSAEPQKLAEINAHFDEFKTKTGIDPRSFERVAVGMNYKRVSAAEIDFEPIVLARGNFNAPALVAAGKIGLNGKFREEKIGDRSLLVFSLRDVAAQISATGKRNGMSKFVSKLLSGETAVTTLDAGTLVFGNPAQVRQMFANKTRVNADLTALAQKNPNALVSFGGNVPANFDSMFRFGNAEIDRLVKSLRQLYGSVDVASGNASILVAARTDSAKSAEDLETSLTGLQQLAGMFLGGKKDAKSQVAIRAVENLKIVRANNDVQMQTIVAQTDLDKIF
jgi:hypothetical protein